MPTGNDLAGKTIRGYELRTRIGVGGMGAVYLAYQQVVARAVAIKVILPEFANRPAFIQQFEREAQLVARLEHPFIVPLFDYWRDPEGAFLVTRFFTAGSLRNVIEKQPRFEPDAVVRLVDQIGGALHVAHLRGVVHRDLKPENILMDDQGNYYLSDFGIALDLGDDLAVSESEDAFTGSPAYVSPEQIRSQGVTHQADLYSLGYIIHELLTGKHAFTQASITQLIMLHLEQEIPYAPELSEEINEVLAKVTAKDPVERYPDAQELMAAFRLAVAHTRGETGPLRVKPDVALVNPYKGLRAFDEADAADFYGRDLLVYQLQWHLTPTEDRAGRFLCVIGPSGSGKSSLVRAGLMPTLRHGGVPGSANWYYSDLVPGDDLVGALANALLSVATTPLGDVADTLRQPSASLNTLINSALPAGADWFLLIDQFEEVFTQSADEESRQHALNLLAQTVSAPDSRLRLVVTLRADFYDRPLQYEAFGALVRAHTEVILPMATVEMERTITGPAERVGLQVDTSLVATLIADAGNQPGSLPLLQYTLTELFERRQVNLLTLDAYLELGGISGALIRRAEDVYRELSPAHQRLAQGLLLRLINPGEDGLDTRRRATWSEWLAVAGNTEDVVAVRDAFARWRLLSLDHDPVTREPTFEVAHEALIREWGRLRDWVGARRGELQLQRGLASAASDWRRASQDDSYLLSGSRLAAYEDWQARPDVALTPDERQYLQASLAHRDEQNRREAERLAREAAMERRARRQLQVLVLVMAGAAIIAVGLSVFAFEQSRVASSERDIRATQQTIAEASALEANSQLLGNLAQQTLAQDPNRALALAREAARVPQPSASVWRTLTTAAYAPGIVQRIDGGRPMRAVAISPDASAMLATGDIDGQIILRPLDNLAEPVVLGQHIGPVNALAYHPDGSQLASVGDDGIVSLWDMTSGEQTAQLAGHDGQVRGVAFSPDGGRLVTGGADQTVILWDLTTNQALRRFSGHSATVNAVAFAPSGEQIASASDDRTVILWEVGSGQIALTLAGHSDWVFDLAYAPDGLSLYSASFDDTLIRWDTLLGTVEDRFVGHSNTVWSIALGPDGQRLISASGDSTLRLWDVRSASTQAILRGAAGHRGEVLGIALSPDGRRVVSVGDDGQIIVWSAQNDAILRAWAGAHRNLVTTLAIHPGGTLSATAGFDRRLLLWDLTTGAPLAEAEVTRPLYSLTFSPDSEQLFTSDDRGRVQVWPTSPDDAFAPIADWQAEGEAPVGRLIARDGNLYGATTEGEIIVWDISQGAEAGRWTGTNDLRHERAIVDMQMNANGRLLITSDNAGQIIVWQVSDGTPIGRLPVFDRVATAVALTPDGRQVVTGTQDGVIGLWDLTNGTLAYTRQHGPAGSPVWQVRILEDGARFLSASGDGTLQLWDLATGDVLAQYRGHSAGVNSLALASDEQAVLTGDDAGAIILWRLDELAELIAWAEENRLLPELDCDERLLLPGQNCP